jgi:hypothetical protein
LQSARTSAKAALAASRECERFETRLEQGMDIVPGLLRRAEVDGVGREGTLPAEEAANMPMKKLRASIGCLLAALAIVGCGGSGEGMPVSSSIVTIALTATSTDESRIALRSESASLSVVELGLSLRSLAIVPCSPDAAAIAQRDYPVDLAVEPPAKADFESSVTGYCSVVVDVAPSTSDDPAVLEGLSVFVRGTRSDAVPFEVRSALPLAVDLSSMGDSPIDAHYLALGFDLATWFEGVDVEGATVTDGTAFIDATSNTDVLDAFDANGLAAAALYEDADRDGVLDEDELDAIATP